MRKFSPADQARQNQGKHEKHKQNKHGVFAPEFQPDAQSPQYNLQNPLGLLLFALHMQHAVGGDAEAGRVHANIRTSRIQPWKSRYTEKYTKSAQENTQKEEGQKE